MPKSDEKKGTQDGIPLPVKNRRKRGKRRKQKPNVQQEIIDFRSLPPSPGKEAPIVPKIQEIPSQISQTTVTDGNTTDSNVGNDTSRQPALRGNLFNIQSSGKTEETKEPISPETSLDKPLKDLIKNIKENGDSTGINEYYDLIYLQKFSDDSKIEVGDYKDQRSLSSFDDDHKVAKLLDDRAKFYQNERYRDLLTPLMYAIITGKSVKNITLLLDNGADPNQPSFLQNSTPLMAAMYERNIEVIKLLMQKGAFIDQGSVNNNQKPLFIAAEFLYWDAIDEFSKDEERFNVNDLFRYLRYHGHLTIDNLSTLIKRYGFKLDNFISSNGLSAIAYLISHFNLNEAELLFYNFNVIPSKKDLDSLRKHFGQQSRASEEKEQEGVVSLGDLNDILIDDLIKQYRLSITKESKESIINKIANILQTKISNKDFSFRGYRGPELFMHAILSDNDNLVDMLKQVKVKINPVFRMLISSDSLTRDNVDKLMDHGFDLNYVDDYGFNAITYAGSCLKENEVAILCNDFKVTISKKDLNFLRDYFGHKWLNDVEEKIPPTKALEKILNIETICSKIRECSNKDEEVKKAYIDIIKQCLNNLSDKKISVNDVVFGKEERTLLTLAAQYNIPELVEPLIAAGIDVKAFSVEGDDAITYAAFNNNEKVLEALCQNGADVNESHMRRLESLHRRNFENESRAQLIDKSIKFLRNYLDKDESKSPKTSTSLDRKEYKIPVIKVEKRGLKEKGHQK